MDVEIKLLLIYIVFVLIILCLNGINYYLIKNKVLGDMLYTASIASFSVGIPLCLLCLLN